MGRADGSQHDERGQEVVRRIAAGKIIGAASLTLPRTTMLNVSGLRGWIRTIFTTLRVSVHRA
jgi:hypothetical protein